MANKVQFGVKQFTYCVITASEGGYTYGTPVLVPGAVNITLEKAGDSSTFYADNVPYYQSIANNGYTGSIELAKVPDSMLEDIFGETKESDGTMIEKAGTEPKAVAISFCISGNEGNEYIGLYNVTIDRPGYAAATTTESKEPKTQSMDFTAMPSMDSAHLGEIKAKKSAAFTETVAGNWFLQ